MTTRTLTLIVTLVLALMATACGSATDDFADVPAVAESNASGASLGGQEFCTQLVVLDRYFEENEPGLGLDLSEQEFVARTADLRRLWGAAANEIDDRVPDEVSRYVRASHSLARGMSDAMTLNDGLLFNNHVEVAQLVHSKIDHASVVDYVDSTCPAATSAFDWITSISVPNGPSPEMLDEAWADPRAQEVIEQWLDDPSILATAEPLSTGSSSTEVVEGLDDTGAVAVSDEMRSLSGSGSLVFESVTVTVSGASWSRSHTAGTARDSDVIYVSVVLDFDRGHDFDWSNLALMSPDGAVYPPEPGDGALALDRATVRFPVDVDVDTLNGWTFEVSRGNTNASTSLD